MKLIESIRKPQRQCCGQATVCCGAAAVVLALLLAAGCSRTGAGADTKVGQGNTGAQSTDNEERIHPLPPPFPQTWLSSLPETNVAVAAGHFGKYGSLGEPNRAICIRNVTSHFGIGWRAPGHVEYALNGKYRTFRTTVAMDDSSESGTQVEFHILGDGKDLWRSFPILRGGGEPCMLDVTGIHVLRLESRFAAGAIDDRKPARAAWWDPWVSEAAVSADELAMYSPERLERLISREANAKKVRKLFSEERFADLEALMKSWRTPPVSVEGTLALNSAYEHLANPTDMSTAGWDAHFARLERWKKAEPKSLTPLVVIGKSYINYGWKARGMGFAYTITPEGGKLFEQRLQDGAAALSEARKYGEDTGLYGSLISLAVGNGDPNAAKQAFEREQSICPKCWDAYGSMAIVLLPQWYGRPTDIADFAKEVRDRLGGDLGNDYFYRIAIELYRFHPDTFFESSGFKYTDLARGIRALAREHPEETLYLNYATGITNGANDYDLAFPLLRLMDPITYAPRLWKSYAFMEFFCSNGLRQLERGVTNVLSPQHGRIGSIDFWNDATHLITCGHAGALEVYDYAKSCDPEKSIPIEHDAVGMAVDLHANTAIVRWAPGYGRKDSAAMVYFLKSGNPPIHLVSHAAVLNGQAISPDGKRCAVCSRDGTATIWPLPDAKNPLTLKDLGPVYNVAFSSDGKTLATSGMDGAIRLWNTETGASLGPPLNEGQKSHGRCRLKFLPDGSGVVTGATDGTIRRWNLTDRTFRQLNLDAADVSLTQIEVSHDGKWLAVGRLNGELDYISLANMKVVQRHYGNFFSIYGVAFSPDDHTLASSSLDGTVLFWSVGEANPVKILTFPENRGASH